MTDMGKELGLSHALLYRFVESKEALFQLALLGTAAPERLSDLSVPLPTPAPGEALKPLADWTAGNTSFPFVKAALLTNDCDGHPPGIPWRRGRVLLRRGGQQALLALLERSAADIPELQELYFGKSRRGQVEMLEEYVERRTRCGHLRRFRTPPWPPSSLSKRWHGSRGTDETTPIRSRPMTGQCDKASITPRGSLYPGRRPTAAPGAGDLSPLTPVDRLSRRRRRADASVEPAVLGLARVDRRTYVVAGVLFAVLMALSGRYGFHRDELYFLDCARHLAPSYVDQPVLTPLLARLSLWAFGVSLAGTSGVVGTRRCRNGGPGWAAGPGVRRERDRTAPRAIGAATMPALLGADHLFGPTIFDLVVLDRIGIRRGPNRSNREYAPLADRRSVARVGSGQQTQHRALRRSPGHRHRRQRRRPATRQSMGSSRVRSRRVRSPSLTSGGKRPITGRRFR